MRVELEGLSQEAVAEIVRLLELHEGTLTPEMLVDAARPPTSPLHALFEWNESRAAELYRLQQAYGLLRRVRVVVDTSNGPVRTRAFWPIADGADGDDQTGRQPYRLVTVIMSREDWRQMLLERARDEMLAWRQRYAILKELAPVFSIVDDVLPLLQQAAETPVADKTEPV